MTTTSTLRNDSGYSQPAPDCPLCQNNTMVWETTHGWKCNRAGCHTIISRNAANAKVERLKRPYGCKCQTLRERSLGDGCDECNKALVIEMLTDERDELEAEVERLRSTLRSFILVSPIEFERMEKIEAEVERLRAAMRSFINFMDENLGTTADWPMEAAFDDEETCQRYCDLLNAMKRIVKPEDIN